GARYPLNDLRDNGNLPAKCRMRIGLVKQRCTGSFYIGLVTLHDFLHVDEDQSRLCGKEVPQAVVVVLCRLERHVWRRLFRVEPRFVRIADDHKLYTLVVQSTRQGEKAVLKRRHCGGVYFGRYAAAKKQPSV